MPARSLPTSRLSLATLRKRWPQLHQSDAEPWPQDARVQQAWLLFHRGDFDGAIQLGLAAGGAGLQVANKAQCFLARRLPAQDAQRLALLQQVAERSAAQLAAGHPALAQVHFWRGHALAQYCQGLHVAKALALGLSAQARVHLEMAVAMAPHHADAHLALAGFHADLVDKVGPLIARMSYGASAQASLSLLAQAASLQARSGVGLVEQARALLTLQGEMALAQAKALYEQAARLQPLDEVERQEIEIARAELRS
jgi:hypothetical protein